MTQILKLAQLVAPRCGQMQVGTGWIQPSLARSSLPLAMLFFDLGEHFGFDEQFVAAALHDVELLLGRDW